MMPIGVFAIWALGVFAIAGRGIAGARVASAVQGAESLCKVAEPSDRHGESLPSADESLGDDCSTTSCSGLRPGGCRNSYTLTSVRRAKRAP